MKIEISELRVREMFSKEHYFVDLSNSLIFDLADFFKTNFSMLVVYDDSLVVYLILQQFYR